MVNEMVTAIDIGTSKIASIIAKISEDEKKPRIMGFSSVASSGVKRGQIVDINQVTMALEQCIEKTERMAGTKISSAYITVGGPHIESLNSHGVVAIAQPDVEITESDVSRAIDAARAISISSSREVIEVIPREYVVDGQGGIKNPLGMSGVRLEVNTHIITAALTNLRNLDRSLSDLGIQSNSNVFSGLASAVATLTGTERELGVVLVDIGGGKTDICVYVEGALSYSSSIPIGARHITNDIAVGLRLSLDSAEKIKLFFSDPDFHQKEPEKKSNKKDEIDVSKLRLPEGMNSVSYKTVIDGIIKPRVEEIFEKVYAEIESSGFVDNVPSGLVVTGGGAKTVILIDIAKKVTGMSARIGVPRNVTGLVDEVLFPQYAAVVGLLIYARDFTSAEQKMKLKDFDKIFRNLSFKGSFKKVTDLFKSFIP